MTELHACLRAEVWVNYYPAHFFQFNAASNYDTNEPLVSECAPESFVGFASVWTRSGALYLYVDTQKCGAEKEGML